MVAFSKLQPILADQRVLYAKVGSGTWINGVVSGEGISSYSKRTISEKGSNAITGALPIANESSISFLRV